MFNQEGGRADSSVEFGSDYTKSANGTQISDVENSEDHPYRNLGMFYTY
jgi:hypothetical protein